MEGGLYGGGDGWREIWRKEDMEVGGDGGRNRLREID